MIYFVLHPDTALDVRNLERITSVPSRSLRNEMARLEALGLLCRERGNRVVRYRALDVHPRWAALREMVREFTAPEDLIRSTLTHLAGVEAAFIFGSCARGQMDANSDIDVFVLGDVEPLDNRLEFGGATLEAAMVLRREVNPVYYTRQRLERRREGGFLKSVLAKPKIWLIGDDRVLAPS